MTVYLVPVSLCLGAIILPFTILATYWNSYTSNILWGGFMPFVRERYGYAQPQPTKQKIDVSNIKLPRRTIITAALVAFLVFLGMNFLLFQIGWKGSMLSGVIVKLLISGVASFGMFITITTSALSRRIQQLRAGEILDDDDDI